MDVFTEESSRFTEMLVPRQEQDVFDLLRSFAARTFVRTALVSDVDKETEEQILTFTQLVELFSRSTNSRAFQPLLWPDLVYDLTPDGRSVRRLRRKVEAFCARIISRRRLELAERAAAGSIGEDNQEQRATLIDILIDPQVSAVLRNDDRWRLKSVRVMTDFQAKNAHHDLNDHWNLVNCLLEEVSEKVSYGTPIQLAPSMTSVRL